MRDCFLRQIIDKHHLCSRDLKIQAHHWRWGHAARWTRFYWTCVGDISAIVLRFFHNRMAVIPPPFAPGAPIIRFRGSAQVMMTLSDASIGCEARGKKGGSKKEKQKYPDARSVLLMHHSRVTQVQFSQARHANGRWILPITNRILARL